MQLKDKGQKPILLIVFVSASKIIALDSQPDLDTPPAIKIYDDELIGQTDGIETAMNSGESMVSQDDVFGLSTSIEAR